MASVRRIPAWFLVLLVACGTGGGGRAVDCSAEAHLLRGDGPHESEELTTATGRLEGLLSNLERETFAGLWLARKPRFHVKVVFAADPAAGRATIGPYLDGADLRVLRDVVVVCETRHSLRKLRRDTNRILRTAPDVPYDLAIDVARNRIEVFVASDEAHDAFEEHGLPETAVLIREPALSTPG